MKHLFFIFSILLLAACKTIQPSAPPIEVGFYKKPAQEKSNLKIPVEMDLRNQFDLADKAVPYRFKGKQEQCEDVSFFYQFNREPISINGYGKVVNIEIDGKYALKLNYCPKCTDFFSSTETCIIPRVYVSCGVNESMRRIQIRYATTIDLKADYSLSSDTKLNKINPVDPCEISVFKYDATGELVKEVKKSLKDLAKEIDKQVEAIEIRKEAEKVWNTFAAPIAFDGYGFLSLNPKKLGVNNLRLHGSKIYFDLAVEAYPELDLSPRENVTPNLPDLSALPNQEGFNINLNLIANYDSLSTLINQSVSGQVIQIKRQKIILTQAKIHGASNQQLTFEIGFTGSKSGNMYFKGTPTYNDSLQEISFPDLQFDLETKNTLIRSAKWLFDAAITNKIRSLARYNMTAMLVEAAKKIEKEMNAEVEPGVFIKGKMDHVRVSAIFPSNDKLIVSSNLKGNLALIIK